MSEMVTLALANLFFGLFGIAAVGMAGAALVGLLNALSPGATDFGAKALVAGGGGALRPRPDHAGLEPVVAFGEPPTTPRAVGAAEPHARDERTPHG